MRCISSATMTYSMCKPVILLLPVFCCLALLSPLDEGHIGVIENITLPWTALWQDRIMHYEDSRKTIEDHALEIGHELKIITKQQEESRDAVMEVGQNIRQLSQDVKTLIWQQVQTRQERQSQHQEMMYVFHQILENVAVTKKERDLSDAKDCSVLFKSGKKDNGIYRIKPEGWRRGFDVYCDMENHGGGWTVIQRRGNFETPSDYFFKTWHEYKIGFGEMEKEFWLGNDRISALSRQGSYELRIDMWSYNSEHLYAIYKTFRLDGEVQLYKLHVGGFSGTARDSLDFHNGMRFSTQDHDNDLWLEGNCAARDVGAWWYHGCGSYSNLNGKRDPKSGTLYWYHTTGPFVHLSYVQMKIRPTSTSSTSTA